MHYILFYQTYFLYSLFNRPMWDSITAVKALQTIRWLECFNTPINFVSSCFFQALDKNVFNCFVVSIRGVSLCVFAIKWRIVLLQNLLYQSQGVRRLCWKSGIVHNNETHFFFCRWQIYQKSYTKPRVSLSCHNPSSSFSKFSHFSKIYSICYQHNCQVPFLVIFR